MCQEELHQGVYTYIKFESYYQWSSIETSWHESICFLPFPQYQTYLVFASVDKNDVSS